MLRFHFSSEKKWQALRGGEVCWSQRGTSRRGRLGAHGPERSRSGKGYAVDRDWGARVDAERHGVCRPHCPAPVTAGEACSKACWENGGLSGRRGRPGSGGVGRAGEPLGKRKVEDLAPESGKGRITVLEEENSQHGQTTQRK
ncbi:transcription elongation factor A protein-like 1 isoform X2 [Pan paniscus]|uniref:transcription elongation factor A protein-like 1 isoform X2 n=1 Tax=Pan paniscus TaxID=9597 RepID=UPI003005E3E9